MLREELHNCRGDLSSSLAGGLDRVGEVRVLVADEPQIEHRQALGKRGPDEDVVEQRQPVTPSSRRSGSVKRGS